VKNETFRHLPTCLRYCWLTKHHIFPKRNHGKQRNDTIITLCQTCHEKVEERLPKNPTPTNCVSTLIGVLYWSNLPSRLKEKK
jgi:hypothetical protein